MRAQENNLVGGLTSSSTTTATVVNNTNNNEKFNANNTTSCTTTSCPNKGKIQTLRQRKTELEKLLEEKNVLLQQIQRQEAQIVGNEWLTTSSSSSLSATPIDISSAGNNKDDQIIGRQQSTSSTLRRKVGSSFKLPRIVKKEHQTDIENLLLEKKLQQEICNTSYKLANDLTLSKSVRGSQKAEYEAAQQKLNLINQNLNVLKKRQLRSHSTSFSENLLTQNNNNNGNNSNSDYMNHNNANTINNGDISSLNLKTSPLSLTSSLASPQPSFSQPIATILSTNLRNNTNYNLNSNNSGDCTLLIPSKRTNNTLAGTTTNAYTTNKINNNNSIKNNKSVSNNNISTNNSSSNNNNVNSYLFSDRRNSIKSAILNSSSKHNSTSSSSSSTGLVQHFDRTLKNHRSDYDINRIIPSQQIDKYQFNEEFCTNINRLNDSYSLDNNGDAEELSKGDLNYSNNYCNTFPIQLQYQRNHYNVIDCNLSSISSQNILKQQQHHHQQQTQGQNQHHPQYITTAENYDDNYYNRGTIYDNSEFEVINSRNRVSENFEKSSVVNTKDGRYYVGVQQSLQNNVTSYDNDDSNINFYLRNSHTIYSTNSDHNITQTCGNDWKQNKVYNDSNSFDAVSYFQSVNHQSTNSLNAAQQQQQQTGLGGFWKILPNNERIWYSTTDDNDDQKTISSIQQKNKLQQQIQNSYLSDDVSSIITPTTKDENNSDKISISSINSETNKKSREKQWLETLLDTPIIQPKPSTLINNQQDSGITTIQQQQQQQPRPVSHQYLYHYHHHDATNIFPSTQLVQYNLNTIPNAFYPANHKVHSNGYKERSKLSSQSMSNKTYQRSTIQQKLEDQSRLSHSTSVLNKQFTDHHHYHHQQQQKQLENQSHNNNNNNTLMNSNENIILNYHNNEIIGNEIDKLHHQKQQHQHQQQQPHYYQQLQQQQSQSNYHTSFHQSSPNHHHHHYHMLPQSTNNTSRITNNIDDNNMIPSSESLSYITASASSPSPVASSLNTTTTVASNLTSSNNFYNKTALITNAINKAQDIRVESPKNMTVIQKAFFVPYKEVTKPFEMSDFYKYSTKFRQKDNQQQQLITSINNSSTINTSKQSQQQQPQQQQFNIGTINTNNNNNNNVNNYDTRNTTTVEKVK